jgi:large subunit ribosomal protein L5
VPALMKEFGLTNALAAPRLEKVVLNMGVKEGPLDQKLLEQLTVELSMITGQQPVVTRAKKAIAAFKLRANTPIGLKVTLRRTRMYEFVQRFIDVACPQIRDFRGFPSTSFDQQGNYSFGIQEQLIFPEINYEKMRKTQGMDITFVTSTTDKAVSKRFLELMGFPFRK